MDKLDIIQEDELNYLLLEEGLLKDPVYKNIKNFTFYPFN